MHFSDFYTVQSCPLCVWDLSLFRAAKGRWTDWPCGIHSAKRELVSRQLENRQQHIQTHGCIWLNLANSCLQWFPFKGYYWDPRLTFALSTCPWDLAILAMMMVGEGNTVNACRLYSVASAQINHKINSHNIFFSWTSNTKIKSLCKW